MDRMLFIQDSVIKQQPIQANQLPSNRRQNVPLGTLLVLQSYNVPSATPDHFRIGLKNLQIKGFANWFAFADHVRILEEAFTPITTVEAMVAKQTEKNVVRITADRNIIGNQQDFLKIVFNQDTVVKRKPVDSTLLNDQSKQTIPAGTELVLLTSSPDTNNIVRLPIEDGHVKFTLKDMELKGFSRDWYAFNKHVGIQLLG